MAGWMDIRENVSMHGQWHHCFIFGSSLPLPTESDGDSGRCTTVLRGAARHQKMPDRTRMRVIGAPHLCF